MPPSSFEKQWQAPKVKPHTDLWVPEAGAAWELVAVLSAQGTSAPVYSPSPRPPSDHLGMPGQEGTSCLLTT